MSTATYCDICKFSSPTVKRYGLSRQIRTDVKRPDGHHKYKRQVTFGGIDICDPCWEIAGKPKKKKAA